MVDWRACRLVVTRADGMAEYWVQHSAAWKDGCSAALMVVKKAVRKAE